MNQEEQSFTGNDLKLNLSQVKTVNKEELKGLILHYQNQQEKGYYSFADWGGLHREMFGVQPDRLPQTALNLWRVLKLINFGDDFIPTGLIYDTLVTLMLMAADPKAEGQRQKSLEQVQDLLRSIFFKFIEFNGKYLSEEEKQELAFFKVIRTVAQGYRKIIFSNFDANGKVMSQQGPLSRNEQLYKMHDVFVYKKNLEKLKKIEEEFKQCTFEPDLSYTSRTMMAESKYMEPSRVRRQQLARSHLLADPHYVIPEEQYEEDRLFRANPVPIYPQVSPVGVNQHLERMQRSRQINKINSLRAYSSHQIIKKQVKQFGIDQRDRQRRSRMVNSYKILFMIKVEVAKRIYRVKVRQNMGVTDVVRAIEMMVGFKHPEIQEIVKGYFINYDMRRAPPKQGITEFSYEDI